MTTKAEHWCSSCERLITDERDAGGWPDGDDGLLCQDCWEGACAESFWQQVEAFGRIEAAEPESHYVNLFAVVYSADGDRWHIVADEQSDRVVPAVYLTEREAEDRAGEMALTFTDHHYKHVRVSGGDSDHQG